MRCKNSTRKRLTCGNDLGCAGNRKVGEVIRCNGCGHVTVVNRRHIVNDHLKNEERNREFIEAVKRVPGQLLPANLRIESSLSPTT